jgi:hypothetical protein
MSDIPNTSATPEVPLSRIPFTPRAEASLSALCNWMQIAAVINIISAVLNLISAFTPRADLGKLIQAIVAFLVGLWIYQAGTAFRKVVTTDTADQRNLMEGFTLLRRVFLLQAIMVIIALAFVVLFFVLIALVAVSHSSAAR